MTLNEIKRLNNILHKHTGLGTEEKQVDDTVFYPSCYYLNKVIESICEEISSKIADDEEYLNKEIEVEIELLPDDIWLGKDYDFDEDYNYKEVLKLFKLNYSRKYITGGEFKISIFNGYSIHNNKITIVPTKYTKYFLASKSLNVETKIKEFRNLEFEIATTEIQVNMDK